VKRVCLDNHILIWGVRGYATPGQEDRVERARDLIAELDEADAQVIIPAVVVAEFLAGVAKPQHTPLLEVLNRRFQIPPFDVRTAAVAAELWRDAADRSPSLKALVQETFPGIEKAKIKADLMILATALVRKAEILYTMTAHWRSSRKGAWMFAICLHRVRSRANCRSEARCHAC
jgi:predicted nucleic acid-binding protein